MKRFFLAVCLIAICGCAKDIYDFTGDIQGIVKDYNTGYLISNCQISLQPSGKTTVTDGQGQFSFNDLTPGEYSLVFNKAGYIEESKKVMVVSGQITEATQLLKAKSAFSISETLVDFGDLEKTKTVALFNNTDSECSYQVSNIPDWISLSSSQGYVPAESTSSLTITINKENLDYGEHTQTLIFNYSGKSSGDVNLVIKCKKVKISAPTVTCEEYAKNITQTTFDITGTIEATGGQVITSYGHCWSTTPNPTISNSKSNNGSTSSVGAFVSNVTGLLSRTTYYVRAYAENASGVAYSNEVIITTSGAECDKWDGSKAKSFAKGKGSAADPYVIETGAQLVLMKDYGSSHFKLNKDIDLDNHNWPIIELSGTFDGNGHTIYNLKISRNEDNVGFVSNSTGTIKNLTIDGVYIDASNSNNVGAFSGYGGTIIGCTLNLNADSMISGNDYVGGIAGQVYEAEINRCTILSSSQSSVIIGDEYVGGICGYTHGDISNCHVASNISGSTDFTGGIVGSHSPYSYDEAEIINCSYTGVLNGGQSVGGIAGSIGSASTIKYCKVDADIIVSGDYVGGICGYTDWTDIIGCYSTGTLNSDLSNLEYLCGITPFRNLANVQLCYSTMTSNHKNYYGLSKDASLTDCATVVATGWDNYYDNKINCQTSCTNITEFLETAYSEYAECYDFNNTWTWTGKINGSTVNVSCPKLAWEK